MDGVKQCELNYAKRAVMIIAIHSGEQTCRVNVYFHGLVACPLLNYPRLELESRENERVADRGNGFLLDLPK